ncbi:MAG: ABC transporter ATP-binding protein [Chloroflexota bacterium]
MSIYQAQVLNQTQNQTPEPILEIKNLQTHFKLDTGTIRAVDGVTLTMERGKTLGVIGESGCGKSVTAHSILRLIPSPPGQIVGGEILLHRDDEVIDLAQLKQSSELLRNIRGNDIGMIFQEPMTSFGPLHTIGNQIMETIMIHEKAGSELEARAQAIELLDQVGIPNPAQRVDAYPHEFSGGMRQRAMIAMALSCSPMLLIADEPTTSLDVTIEAQILELLSDMQDQTGMAIMFITHNLAVVSEMADYIAVMYLGKRVEFGTNRMLFENPLHPYTQGLWQSIPKVDGPIARLEPIPGVVPSPRNLPTGCVFASRCAKFMEGVCNAPKPVPTIEVEEGHFVSCYLYTDEYRDPVQPNIAVNAADEVDAQFAEEAVSEVEVVVKDKPLIEVHNLQQFFPIQTGFFRRTVGYVKAVNGVSLTIHEGETLGLVGESGCGKSTLGRSILRLYEPTDGEVILHHDGKKLPVLDLEYKEMRPIRANMQMIFQDPFASLNERMNVLQNVIEPLVCNDIGTQQEREEKAENLLMQVGLRPEHIRRYPHSFSGGQRQRIGIARALSIEPKFIVADEPVFALDVSVQAQILNLMKDLQAEFGLSYLFISHDMAVIRYMADRIAVMYVGKLVEYASRDELLQNPAHPYTEALHSAVPRLAGYTGNTREHDRRSRIVLEGSPPDPSNLPEGCVFQSRCRYAQARCSQEEPQLREISDGHFVACHLTEELDLIGIQS